MAKALGADHTVLVTSRDGQAVADNIVQTMGGQPDVSIECSGAEPSVQTAIYVR